MTCIAAHIEAFLREHLARHRGASQHTCDSYASSFQFLFEFASRKIGVAPSALMLEQLDAPLVSSFLEHLETTRRNSAETRNVRLAAIRSFFRFLQHRVPAALDQVRRVLAIPFKKADTRLVPYLSQDEVQALLDAPDPATREGIRDRAMLHLAVCAGLRVSELTGLCTDDVAPQSMSIRARGKGRRERALPLWKTTASAVRAWLVIRGALLHRSCLSTHGVSPSAAGESRMCCGAMPIRRAKDVPHYQASRSRHTYSDIPARWLCFRQRKISERSHCGWGIVIWRPRRSMFAPIPARSWRPLKRWSHRACAKASSGRLIS
jgi:integrase/recombinase XerD